MSRLRFTFDVDGSVLSLDADDVTVAELTSSTVRIATSTIPEMTTTDLDVWPTLTRLGDQWVTHSWDDGGPVQTRVRLSAIARATYGDDGGGFLDYHDEDSNLLARIRFDSVEDAAAAGTLFTERAAEGTTALGTWTVVDDGSGGGGGGGGGSAAGTSYDLSSSLFLEWDTVQDVIDQIEGRVHFDRGGLPVMRYLGTYTGATTYFPGDVVRAYFADRWQLFLCYAAPDTLDAGSGSTNYGVGNSNVWQRIDPDVDQPVVLGANLAAVHGAEGLLPSDSENATVAASHTGTTLLSGTYSLLIQGPWGAPIVDIPFNVATGEDLIDLIVAAAASPLLTVDNLTVNGFTDAVTWELQFVGDAITGQQIDTLETGNTLTVAGPVTPTVTIDVVQSVFAGIPAPLGSTVLFDDGSLWVKLNAALDGWQPPTYLSDVNDAILSVMAGQDAVVYKGSLNASTNPNYPAADAGHVYRIGTAGKIGGASGPNVEVGDTIICHTDGTAAGTHAAVGAQWDILQSNLDGAVIGPASAVNLRLATFSGTTGKLIADGGAALSVDGTLAGNTDAKVPTEKATKTYVDTGLGTKQNSLGFTAENVANKDTDATMAANSDTKYASQKATKTALDTKVEVLYFSQTGPLTVAAGTMRIPLLRAATIVGVRMAANTAPTGQSILVDVNKNGTTIFTTQGNRPAIAAAANDSGAGTAPNVTTLAAGDYLTCDVDQVGSGVAGSDLVVGVQVRY